MDRSEFDDAMGWMQRQFKSPQEEERLNHFYVVFGQTNEKIFFAAIDKILQSQNTFPTPLELGNVLQECLKEAQSKPKSKPQPQPQPQPHTDPKPDYAMPKVTSQMGKDSFALLRKLEDSENFGPKDLALAMMIDMHEKYPNEGWEEEGQKLLRDYERMKERAKNFETSIFSLRRKTIR